jgi:hypothetical protein
LLPPSRLARFGGEVGAVRVAMTIPDFQIRFFKQLGNPPRSRDGIRPSDARRDTL